MFVRIPMAIYMAMFMTHCATIFTTIYVEVLLLAFGYLCPVGISARKGVGRDSSLITAHTNKSSKLVGKTQREAYQQIQTNSPKQVA